MDGEGGKEIMTGKREEKPVTSSRYFLNIERIHKLRERRISETVTAM